MDYKLIDRIMALSTLIGHAKLAYVEVDTHLRINSWNKGAIELFGYSEDEAMGQILSDLIPVSKKDLASCEKTSLMSCSHVNNKGVELRYDIFYTPIINFKGEILGVAVLAKDITARLKDKENLKQKEQYLEHISGFAPIGIYQVNIEGHVVYANPEYAWMMGYESAEAVTEQITDFATQAFYDSKRADEFMFGVFEADAVTRFRCRLKRKDNTFLWALCYAKATRDDAGRMNGFEGFSIDISETVRVEQDLKKANERLKMLSVIDGLTQIPNRRRFDEYLDSEWTRHFRSGKPISVVLCDIDFFKLYNDSYGHQAGDDCLQRVAAAIAESVRRSSDLAARYGGEEFAVILPETGANGAFAISEEIRRNIEALKLNHGKSKVNKYVTLSNGVATLIPGDDNSPEALVAFADEELYQAKETGRNRSVGKDLPNRS